MLIILPPSETKAFGGQHPPVDFSALSFPQLNEIRADIAADLQALDVDSALGVLGISQKLRGEAEANTHLLSTPTMPAVFRYTGVLYDALSPTTLPSAALARLAVGSALFGVVRAQDLIPHYRLSGSTKLPRRRAANATADEAAAPATAGAKAAATAAEAAAPTMKARWGSAITQQLQRLQDDGELLVDLRSGTYQQLGKVPGAVTVRVESVQPDGTRKVVSHFNKHYKGILARELAQVSPAPTTLAQAIEAASEAGARLGFGIEAPAAGAAPSAQAAGAKAGEITMVV